ncbi:MAG: hypothetical protein AAGB34_08665 [Planctomycetota bacterium]
MTNPASNGHNHEPQPGGPLDIPVTGESREDLVKRANEFVAYGGLTPESAAAVDRLVESGWSGDLMPEALASLGVKTNRGQSKQAIDRIERTIEPRNPFNLPLPGQGEERGQEEDERSSWVIARVVGLAAAVALGVTMFVPGLSPLISVEDDMQTGGSSIQHRAVQPDQGTTPGNKDSEESEEDRAVDPRRGQ